MVNIFNETVSHVLNNYIPQETTICDDPDPHELISKSKKPYKIKLSQILITTLFWRSFNAYRINLMT